MGLRSTTTTGSIASRLSLGFITSRLPIAHAHVRSLLMLVVFATSFGDVNIAADQSSLSLRPADSPIAWSPAAKADVGAAAISNALIRGGTVLGRDVSGAQLVRFTDRFPFGTPAIAEAWLISDTEIQVTNGAKQESARLSVVVDAQSGNVTTIFTPAKSSWVVPSMPTRSPEDEARSAYWEVAPGGVEKTTMTAEQVLARVWMQFGVAPSAPGQIVMRPRRVATRFPASRKDRKPLYPEGVAWIVQVMGFYISDTPGRYWTGYLMLVDDKSGDVIVALSMP